jgi:hypothetical protein
MLAATLPIAQQRTSVRLTFWGTWLLEVEMSVGRVFEREKTRNVFGKLPVASLGGYWCKTDKI